jgi:hypothetical protein
MIGEKIARKAREGLKMPMKKTKIFIGFEMLKLIYYHVSLV